MTATLLNPKIVDVKAVSRYDVETKFNKFAVEIRPLRLAVETKFNKFAVEIRPLRLAVETKLSKLGVLTYPIVPRPITVDVNWESLIPPAPPVFVIVSSPTVPGVT